MTTATQVPTLVDQRTGQAVPVYLGGEPLLPSPVQLRLKLTEEIITPQPRQPLLPRYAVPSLLKLPIWKRKRTPMQQPPAAADSAGKSPSDSVAPVDDPPRNDRGQFIPKKRFDEVNQRRKAAEDKLAQIERENKATGQAQTATYDFDAKEKEYLDLVLDGKTDEAIALRKEIRAAERSEFQRLATEQAQTVTKQTTVQDRIQEISTRYEADYEVFNPESEHYSEDVLDDLHSLYTGYGQSGKFADAAVAFEAAIQKTLKMHGIEKKGVTESTAAAPVIDPARTAQKRVEAIANQPPLIARTGAQSADHGHSNISVSVTTLGADEIMKLPRRHDDAFAAITCDPTTRHESMPFEATGLHLRLQIF